MANLSQADIIESWQNSAELFVVEVLGVVRDDATKKVGVTKQQSKALAEITKIVAAKVKKHYTPAACTEEELRYARKSGISIMAGKGLGKSAFEAWINLWFLCCFKNAKLLCTAPTQHHLKDVTSG